MHAYDFDSVQTEGQAELTIKYANSQDHKQIETLDGKKIDLQDNDLVICKQNTPLCLLGIMGMQNSAVHDQTKKVLLEAAAFNQELIRKSFKNHNLRTESYQRHEKAVDPENTTNAIYLCIETLLLSCPDLKISGPIQDAYPNPYPRPEISLPLSKLNSYLSSNLSAEQAQEILQRLEFESRLEDQNLTVTAPSFRATGDINIYQDIIEEIGEFMGITISNHKFQISNRVFNSKINPKIRTQYQKLPSQLRLLRSSTTVSTENISSTALNSISTLISNSKCTIQRSLAIRASTSRNLVQSLLTNKQEKSDIKFFEIGRTYTEIDSSSPPKSSNSPLSNSLHKNFFQVKGTVEKILIDMDSNQSNSKKENKFTVQHPYKYSIF